MIKFFKNSKDVNDTKKIIKDYDKKISTLTSKELKVYNQVIQGYNFKEISKKLNLTENIIESYLESILKKLRVNSKVELIISYGSIFNSVNNINTMDEEIRNE